MEPAASHFPRIAPDHPDENPPHENISAKIACIAVGTLVLAATIATVENSDYILLGIRVLGNPTIDITLSVACFEMCRCTFRAFTG